jgi:hypothetical protein
MLGYQSIQKSQLITHNNIINTINTITNSFTLIVITI